MMCQTDEIRLMETWTRLWKIILRTPGEINGSKIWTRVATADNLSPKRFIYFGIKNTHSVSYQKYSIEKLRGNRICFLLGVLYFYVSSLFFLRVNHKQKCGFWVLKSDRVLLAEFWCYIKHNSLINKSLIN